MPRGVMVMAETQEEAESKVTAEAPTIEILRSREIDLSGLPPLRSGPLRRHWVVVVQHSDPEEEAKLPQDDDPEEQCERNVRLTYLTMAVDPDLLVTGVVEAFACPACGDQVRLELPPRREGPSRSRAACPHCRAPLVRSRDGSAWDVAPPKREASRTCVFCEAKADSYEHVIPAWISKRLGIKTFLSADDAFVTDESARRKQDISFANYRARIFCRGCNEHFKHLEDAVIPLLVPMARGRTLSLGSESQRLLACWAHKTAIALLAAGDGARAVPQQHLAAVREAGVPGDHSRIAFFNWRGGPVLGTGQADVVRAHGGSPASNAYVAFLAFGHVGFRVFGLDSALPMDGRRTEVPHLLDFWPPKNPLLSWPPPATDNRILPTLLRW